MRDSVPSASYSSICNVLRQWSISLIPTYRVYRLYNIYTVNVRIVAHALIVAHLQVATAELRFCHKLLQSSSGPELLNESL